MEAALLPILTLLLGQLLGYWFAVNQTQQRIVAEKRAEYISRFIGLAYHNLRYLVTREMAAQAGEAVPELAVLGDQAAFFVSDEAAQAIDKLTRDFLTAVSDRIDPDPGLRRDVFKPYKAELDSLRRLLRRELNVTGRWGRRGFALSRDVG